ncbi:HlyD family secretion protein [Clostridium botulinum]|uniref:HlyD family secretion protein n=1 Tax=Clostridium botulinum TaxID=1491 RepID=UPI003DA4F102
MKVYNLHEITDSRILYDKNPPRFMIYVISIILMLLIGFTYWSIKSVKTYIVKGEGIVTTENKYNIMPKVSGEIKEVFIKEGKEVKAGETLVTLKPVESNIQIEQIDSQLAVIDKRIELLNRAEDDVNNGTNGFDETDSEESEFYKKLCNIYVKQEEFKVNEKYLKSQGIGAEQIKEFKDSQQLKAKTVKYEGILQFTNEKENLKFEKSKLNAQKNALNKSKEEFKIVAQSSGKIHLNMPITKGTVLQAGSLIGTIFDKKDKLIVETMVSSVERPRIHVNDQVSLVVGGLNQAEYGTIKAKVLKIDEDATIDKEKGQAFFKVKVQPYKTYLTDKKGEKVSLALGMITETRVKYEKITYMKYFLEQIGVKFN